MAQNCFPWSAEPIPCVSCFYCSGPHLFKDCPSNPDSVFYVGNYNRNQNNFSSNFNQGWMQNSGFQYAQGHGQHDDPFYTQPIPHFPSQNYQQQPLRQPVEQYVSPLESLLKEYIIKNEAKQSNLEAIVQSIPTSLRSLETQIGQLVVAINNEPLGTMPSSIAEPRRECHEQDKMVELKNDRLIIQPEPVVRPCELKSLVTQDEKEAIKKLVAPQEAAKENSSQEKEQESVTPMLKSLTMESHMHGSLLKTNPASISNRSPPPFPLNVNREKVSCNELKAMKYPREMEDCSIMGIVDHIVKEKFKEENGNNPIEVAILDECEVDKENLEECIGCVESQPPTYGKEKQFVSLSLHKKELKSPWPSLEVPLIIEFKPLIVSSLLTVCEKNPLLNVLKIFKKTRNETMVDVKGINSTLGKCKILLWDPGSSFIEQQRRLNPIMQKLVQWWDTGQLRLFPVKLKSSWFNPLRVVQVFLQGAVKILDEEDGRKLKVNGKRVKDYWGDVRENVSIFPREPD